MGGEEYLNNGACIFEWGQLIEPILDIPYTKIFFSRSNENPDYRILKIESK